MRFLTLLIAGLLLRVYGGFAPMLASDDPPAAQRAETMRRYGLDPTSALKSRVRETPAEVLKMFADDGQAAPTAHALTDEERRKLEAAFATLPPLHQRVLRERLRSVSFLDGMPNTALTSTVNPGASFRLFDITIRAAILHQNVSEWLTEKERSCFDAAGSLLRVSIEAGKRDALAYALLHEATYIVDVSLGLTPTALTSEPPAGSVPPTAFTEGVWQEHAIPAPPYRDPLREHVRFRPGGGIFGMDQAVAVYTSLRRTPFVSLYGSSNWNEDLAEYVAV